VERAELARAVNCSTNDYQVKFLQKETLGGDGQELNKRKDWFLNEG
jgi:hypothetical protein